MKIPKIKAQKLLDVATPRLVSEESLLEKVSAPCLQVKKANGHIELHLTVLAISSKFSPVAMIVTAVIVSTIASINCYLAHKDEKRVYKIKKTLERDEKILSKYYSDLTHSFKLFQEIKDRYRFSQSSIDALSELITRYEQYQNSMKLMGNKETYALLKKDSQYIKKHAEDSDAKIRKEISCTKNKKNKETAKKHYEKYREIDQVISQEVLLLKSDLEQLFFYHDVSNLGSIELLSILTNPGYSYLQIEIISKFYLESIETLIKDDKFESAMALCIEIIPHLKKYPEIEKKYTDAFLEYQKNFWITDFESDIYKIGHVLSLILKISQHLPRLVGGVLKTIYTVNKISPNYLMLFMQAVFNSERSACYLKYQEDKLKIFFNTNSHLLAIANLAQTCTSASSFIHLFSSDSLALSRIEYYSSEVSSALSLIHSIDTKGDIMRSLQLGLLSYKNASDLLGLYLHHKGCLPESQIYYIVSSILGLVQSNFELLINFSFRDPLTTILQLSNLVYDAMEILWNVVTGKYLLQSSQAILHNMQQLLSQGHYNQVIAYYDDLSDNKWDDILAPVSKNIIKTHFMARYIKGTIEKNYQYLIWLTDFKKLDKALIFLFNHMPIDEIPNIEKILLFRVGLLCEFSDLYITDNKNRLIMTLESYYSYILNNPEMLAVFNAQYATMLTKLKQGSLLQLESRLEVTPMISSEELKKSLVRGTWSIVEREGVKKILSFRCIDTDLMTEIYHAVSVNNMTKIREILNTPDLDINKLFYNRTILAVAVMNKQTDIVSLLIRYPGINPNIECGDEPLLIFAINHSFHEIVSSVLQHQDINIDVTTACGHSCFLLAQATVYMAQGTDMEQESLNVLQVLVKDARFKIQMQQFTCLTTKKIAEKL